MPKLQAAKPVRWKLWLRVGVGTLFAGATAYAAREVRQFVFADPRFSLHDAILRDPSGNGVLIQGARHASHQRVMQVFAPDFGRSVFRIPIAERRRRLLAIDWVEDATVARIWPNRLIIRIKERTPVAFVNLHPGFSLVDAQGVLLAPPLKTRFALPVLSGVTREQNESERRTRVLAMQQFLADLGPAANNISEINAEQIDDLHATVQMNDRAVELWLGDQNFLSRYQNFVNHYEEIRRRSEQVSTFDLRIDDRIITK